MKSPLLKVTSGVNSASYSYLANAPLVSQISFTNNGAWRMTTSKQFDQLNRLQSMASVAPTFTAASFEYTYNNSNQRTERREADGVYWRFGYDSLGQVTSAKKYWADGIPVAGQQFEYAFDDIGNRTETKTGGDASGSNLRSSAYYPNALNQYWSNTVPGVVDVMGAVLATNSVTVNGLASYRKGEYFRKELAVNNTAAPVWQQITVAAPNEATVTRHEFVAQTPQVFVHDDDGNLVSDGRWNYTWDGENRLVAMAARTGIGPQISLKVEYDAQGRRIRKQVWGNAAWSGSATNDLRFVYDGWNLIAVLSPQSAVLRSFTWGLDLSGSLQGAGGVGGLLMVNDTANGVHYPAFDGNGNVAALVKSDGTLSAQYEYGPFGENLRATGPMAKANPIRFSTQCTDDETDLVCYLRRYYNPSTGRWLSRDPLGSRPGRHLSKRALREESNLYRFVFNDPIGRFDVLGLRANDVTRVTIPISELSCPSNCGPNYTDSVNAELARLRTYLAGIPELPGHTDPDDTRIPSNLFTLLNWFRQLALSLNYDWQAKQIKGAPMDGCPTVKCIGTITLCGKCVTSDVPGNIMFGFAAASVLDDSTRNVGAWVAEALDFDGEFPEQDYDVFDIGQDLFNGGGNDICSIIQRLPTRTDSKCSPCKQSGTFDQAKYPNPPRYQ